MIHSFTIVKPIRASKANVLANYLDQEHVPVHSGLSNLRILAQTERAACFRLDAKVLGFTMTNIQYFEFRAPDQVFQAVNTPLCSMTTLATVREFDSGTPRVRCEATVEVSLDMRAWAYPFRGLVERLLRRLNRKVLDEDLVILERRHKLFGDCVEDYLREGQPLLFKALFARHYGAAARGRRPD